MSTLVNSLKRLYEKSSITEDKVRMMQIENKITMEEMNYILSVSSGEAIL